MSEEEPSVEVKFSPGFIESVPDQFIEGMGLTRKAFAEKCARVAKEVRGKNAQDAMNQFMHKMGLMPGKFGTRGDQQYVEIDGKES